MSKVQKDTVHYYVEVIVLSGTGIGLILWACTIDTRKTHASIRTNKETGHLLLSLITNSLLLLVSVPQEYHLPVNRQEFLECINGRRCLNNNQSAAQHGGTADSSWEQMV